MRRTLHIWARGLVGFLRLRLGVIYPYKASRKFAEKIFAHNAYLNRYVHNPLAANLENVRWVAKKSWIRDRYPF